MFCPFCGDKNFEYAKFCRSCGSSLESVHSGPFAPNIVPQRTAVEYAGFWKRLAAFVIDFILIWIANFVIIFVFVILMTLGGVGETGLDILYNIMSFCFWFVTPWIYWAFMESSSHQATLGKKALNIKVTDYSGQKLTFARATGRHWAKIVSLVTFYIGFIMAGFTTKKQGLHDMISECLVVAK